MVILWLLIIPLCVGMLVNSILPQSKKTLGITFLGGYLLLFSVFELIAIPCMIKIQYSAFKYCVRYYIIASVILTIAGIAVAVKRAIVAFKSDTNTKGFNMLKSICKALFPGDSNSSAEDLLNPRVKTSDIKMQYSVEGIIYWAIFALIVLFQLYMAFTRASFDGDDAYYVVESLLAQQADVMNTLHPYTGISTSLDVRHAFAVITMWIAFIAKVSGIHATIVSHTIIPLVFIPLIYLVYIEIARILFRKKQDMIPVFMIIMSIIVMFGNTSIYTSETFMMMRTWQGKAMVANFVLPMIIWLYLWLFECKAKDNVVWALLFMLNMFAGMCSSLGIFFGDGLMALLTLILLIYTRKLKVIPLAIISIIPSVIYLAVYLIVKMS